jgi:hypothetical protein
MIECQLPVELPVYKNKFTYFFIHILCVCNMLKIERTVKRLLFSRPRSLNVTNQTGWGWENRQTFLQCRTGFQEAEVREGR